MGRILDYIEKSGGGKYVCYKTKKLSLDYNDNDTLAYEDKPVSQFKKSVFAETDQTRKQTVRITGTNDVFITIEQPKLIRNIRV